MAERNLNYRVGPRRQWRSEEFDGLKPIVYDWCRMAAFIDGEGTVDINTCGSKADRYIVRVLIGNTNPNLVIWLKRTFGGNVIYRVNRNPKAKNSYIWSCTAARASWILYNCLPWLLLKGQQAQLMMELQENIDTTRQGRGRRVSDESIAWRAGVKEKLRALNAKGREAQSTITVEEINRAQSV